MNDTRLKPCPFCGGEATTSEKEEIKNMPFGWGWVGCRQCRVFMNWSHGERGKKLAIEAWNTRKPMERIVEQLKEIKSIERVGRGYEMLGEAIEIVQKMDNDTIAFMNGLRSMRECFEHHTELMKEGKI